ncbi:MAG: hypothetical protein CMF69_00565 [Magnetovibrio sp.]|nr:hypothetical protein [Magnetovibrio sp.]|tara:strand:+ start:130 stop:690 length:561 start_codon:yes stop_codon:yes gene_type:complete
MMTEKQETNVQNLEVSPETIVEVVQEGAEIYSEITTSFIQSFTFYEKTLYEWASHLMIEIPEVKSLDEVSFRELLIKLGTNLQIASNYFSVASSMCDAVSGGNSIKKSDVVSAIVANYAKRGAKRPAASVIDQMAESYMSSTVSARVAARIVKNFWKQRMDTLLEVRKVLEQIGMSLHMEMKWTSQ